MRVGVIGLGTIGQTHLAALRRLPRTAIYGADPTPLARDRARPHTARCFDDYRELLSSIQLDGVVIATPPRTHVEIALAALQSGTAVLCEKPLALTESDCEILVRAADTSRKPFLVGFCHRFQPQLRALKQVIDARVLGAPLLVNIAFTHGLTEAGREWIVDRDCAGGGVLFDSGSHAIDLVRFLVGDIDQVGGFTSSAVTAQVEDQCVSCLRSGDVLATLSLSWKTPPWQGVVEVVGSSGRARVDYEGDRVQLRTRAPGGAWRSVRTSRASRFDVQMRHFLACIRGSENPLASARDGLEATRTILQIYGAMT